mmetsp:Transcript_41979/g.72324  ORF Transcript_41979/g.72324 Transcript_41979/m.72324 type:complete len:84 (+) Transcript_41979:126-377(+)
MKQKERHTKRESNIGLAAHLSLHFPNQTQAYRYAKKEKFLLETMRKVRRHALIFVMWINPSFSNQMGGAPLVTVYQLAKHLFN